MKYTLYCLLLLSLIFHLGCSSQKKLTESSVKDNYETGIEFRELDSLVVTPSDDDEGPQPYRGSQDRKWDLIHTDLNISFNWEKKSVMGIASLKLKPYFINQNTLLLDAKDMRIDEVSLAGKKLKTTYEDDILIINFENEYSKEETIELSISYEAFPYGDAKLDNMVRGFYFIDSESPEDFGQLWTQGETEYNSRWFPTLDQPNERCTQSMTIRVPNDKQCLSNGKLESVKEVGSEKVYKYTMDKAHAPYLFALAVGEFAIVEDSWNDVPLSYWVAPEYEDVAAKIFEHTPEMIGFFSNLFDYSFPWPSYNQVVVNEFVSGAMENTGCVIFGSFVQNNLATLVDNPNDGIVAHELAHHWFGDLVTCESWANLTLNEGFANYSEYLWTEYKYGQGPADELRFSELEGYLNEYYTGTRHPLIHYHYKNKEDMFNAHSYNKGGLVLHTLRKHVGDDAFFSALSHYLKTHQYSSTEIHDLRQAFEHITGQDLNWFFDQWFLREGHPEIKLSYEYADGLLHVTAAQQTKEAFIIHTELLVGNGTQKMSIPLSLDKKSQRFSFPVSFTPDFVVPDPWFNHLALWEIEGIEKMQSSIYHQVPGFFWKYNAMNYLMVEEVDIAFDPESTYPEIRLDLMSYNEDEISDALLLKSMKLDSDTRIRALSLGILADRNPQEIENIALQCLTQDSSQMVHETALEVLVEQNPKKALDYINSRQDEQISPLTLLTVYAGLGDEKYYDDFIKSTQKISDFEFIQYGELFTEYLMTQDASIQEKGILAMHEMATNGKDKYRRFGATYTLLGMSQNATNKKLRDQCIENLRNIISIEKDEELLEIYKEFGLE